MFLVCLLTNLAFAGAPFIVKNKTSVGLDLEGRFVPYVAYEMTFGIGNDWEQSRWFLGTKYRAHDSMRFDPHWFLETQHKGLKSIEHGPEIRLDVRF